MSDEKLGLGGFGNKMMQMGWSMKVSVEGIRTDIGNKDRDLQREQDRHAEINIMHIRVILECHGI